MSSLTFEVRGQDGTPHRGPLNAALRDIRIQAPELEDSYLLSAEIHERAKMYRAVFENAALTPTALAKHWKRVYEESTKKRGSNLAVDPPPARLPQRREENLEAARNLMKEMGWR